MGLEQGLDSYVIFMDLSKAFDTIDHRTLLKKLAKYNFSTESIELVASYLSGRQQMVGYQGVFSDLRPLKTGVPQGSILGPLLFLIYINDLPNTSKLFKISIYADDTTLIYSPYHSSKTREISEQINKELEK